MSQTVSKPRPVVVVSACLLGKPVRHDGGHTRARFITEDLAAYVEFRAICPEEGAGMSTPREAVRLVRPDDGGALRLVGNKSGEDWTERMDEYSDATTASLVEQSPSGFILKKGSPSCGLFRVRRYDVRGNRLPSDGAGLFAAQARERFGDVPFEEEGRLNDPGLRHQFLVRLFGSSRVQQLKDPSTRKADLIEFHRKEKLLLMAHSPSRQKELGRLVADSSGALSEVVDAYTALFLRTLAEPVNRGRMVNVLQHMAGYLRGHLSAEDAEELHGEIASFWAGMRHSSAVWTLMRHHLRRHEIAYLLDQTVSEPYPMHLLEPNPDPHMASA